jgi:carbonic anhydrase
MRLLIGAACLTALAVGGTLLLTGRGGASPVSEHAAGDLAAAAHDGHDTHGATGADPHDSHGPAQAGHTGAPHADGHTGPHWTYAGAAGPEAWGRLSAEFAACQTGSQQSPIDLADAVPAVTRTADVSWGKLSGAKIVHNGHTLQVSAEGAGHLMLEGVRYDLLQFHFHHQSEHTLDGRSWPLEVHFVHKAADGRLAVVGILFEPGKEHPGLTPLWWAAPATKGEAPVGPEIDLASFLPAEGAAFRYEGSLTTPPCSEVVRWTVMQTPIEASTAQLAVFAKLFPNNARPVQPLARRYVLLTP